MRLQWEGKYLFEAGDIVEITCENHPFNGFRGVVSVCYSESQFGVTFLFGSLSLWAEDLSLIETHRPIKIPSVFTHAWEKEDSND